MHVRKPRQLHEQHRRVHESYLVLRDDVYYRFCFCNNNKRTIDVAEELELEAYLGMGVAMRLHGRADRQAAGPGSASQALIPAAGASHLPGPRSYDADQQDKALAYLEHYLDWCVKKGRARCDGCLQERGEDAPMLTCSGCRVARCCSADHQKMASETRSSMADVCGAPGGERGEVGQPAVDLTAHGGNQDSESPHVAVSHP